MKKIKICFALTRRNISNVPDTLKYRDLTAGQLRKLGVDSVDIDRINEEGFLYSVDDHLKVLEKSRSEEVDSLMMSHCNFGTDGVQLGNITDVLGLSSNGTYFRTSPALFHAPQTPFWTIRASP